MVRTIKSALESTTQSLDSIVTAYNYTPNATIDDETPCKRFFGRELKTPFDIYKPRAEAAEPTPYQRSFKSQYDTKHGVRERPFAVGEEVTVQLSNGNCVPAVVTEFQGKAMIRLSIDGDPLVRHRNQVSKRQAQPQRAEPASADDDEYFDFVTAILPQSTPADALAVPDAADSSRGSTITPDNDVERQLDFEDSPTSTPTPEAPENTIDPLAFGATDASEAAGAASATGEGPACRRKQPPRACKQNPGSWNPFSWS